MRRERIVTTGISALGRCQRKSMMMTEIVTITSTIAVVSVRMPPDQVRPVVGRDEPHPLGSPARSP